MKVRKEHPQWLETLLSFMTALNNWAAKLAGLLLIGMVLAVTVSVFARLLYTYTGIALSVTWAEEVARYMMVGCVFIGGAVAAYHLRLIGVDIVPAMAPPALARWLRLISQLMTLTLAVLLVWKSTRLLELGLRQSSPALEIPMTSVYALMYAGCILLALNSVVHAMREIVAPIIEVEDEPEVQKPPVNLMHRSQEVHS